MYTLLVEPPTYACNLSYHEVTPNRKSPQAQVRTQLCLPSTEQQHNPIAENTDETYTYTCCSNEVPFDFDIHVYQGEDVLGGQQIRFSDAFRPGKPVVAVMWAGLCPTCRRELPEIQAAYEAYGDRITFIGIDIGPFTGLGFEEQGRALLKELDITFPAGGPPDGQFMREYRWLNRVTPLMQRISTFFLIGAGVYLVYYWVFVAGLG